MDENLKKWRQTELKNFGIEYFYYVAYLDNFASIMNLGIHPKNEVERRGLKYSSFALEDVQDRRHVKTVRISDGRKFTLHDLVPIFLNPRNAALYRRFKDGIQQDLAICIIDSSILCDDIDGRDVQFAFADGNAASVYSNIYSDLRNLNRIPWDVLNSQSWVEFEDGKRKSQSEFLIWPLIAAEKIGKVIVGSVEARKKLEDIANQNKITVEIMADIQRKYFFGEYHGEAVEI